MQKIAVVIVHYNNKRDTDECIDSLKKIKFQEQEISIIVVDNGSKEEFKRSDVIVIRNDENTGFAGGNNVGIKHAIQNGASYILLLNNDTLVEKNFLKELVVALESNPSVGIASPKIYFAKRHEFHKNRYKSSELGHVFWYAGGIMDWQNVIGKHRGVDEVDAGQYEQNTTIDFASGCCMLMKKEVVEKIGLLSEDYFLYYEDADFSMKAKRAGFDIWYVAKSIIWHKNAGSTGGSGSQLQDYYISRNRMLFGIIWAPVRAKLSLLKESLVILLNGRYWQKRGILDYYLMRFGKGSFK